MSPPWDLGMAPGRQPCNMTYTKEQTPVLHRTLTQGTAEQFLSSAAASCMEKESLGLLPTQLPDKLQEPQGLGSVLWRLLPLECSMLSWSGGLKVFRYAPHAV